MSPCLDPEDFGDQENGSVSPLCAGQTGRLPYGHRGLTEGQLCLTGSQGKLEAVRVRTRRGPGSDLPRVFLTQNAMYCRQVSNLRLM